MKDAGRNRLRNFACPSLVCVLLRLLSFAHSEPPRGRVGLFAIDEHDSDVSTGVRDGNFDDDVTN